MLERGIVGFVFGKFGNKNKRSFKLLVLGLLSFDWRYLVIF